MKMTIYQQLAAAEKKATENLMLDIKNHQMVLLERDNYEAPYGFTGTEAIFLLGSNRYYIKDGYGELGLQGGCVRWCHGAIWLLKSTDTLDSIKQYDDSYASPTMIYAAMKRGYDVDRPVIDTSTSMIEKIAEDLGLW